LSPALAADRHVCRIAAATAFEVGHVLRSTAGPSFFVGAPAREYSCSGAPPAHSVSSPSERRVQFSADELSLDILALLVSCGQAVRETDVQALHAAVRSEETNSATATSQPQCVVADAAER